MTSLKPAYIVFLLTSSLILRDVVMFRSKVMPFQQTTFFIATFSKRLPPVVGFQRKIKLEIQGEHKVQASTQFILMPMLGHMELQCVIQLSSQL